MSRTATLDSQAFPAAPTPRLPVIAYAKFELALLALLLLTLCAIVFGDPILSRTLSFSPASLTGYVVNWHGDEAESGNSTATPSPSDLLAWSCKLRRRYAFPYCGYEILFDSGRQRHGIDLSKFDRLTLDLDYAGPAKTVRLFVRNFDQRYSSPGVSNSAKYNRVEFPVHTGRQSVRIKFVDFSVADWWIEKNRIPPELSRPQFDNVIGIEVETGTGGPPGAYRFIVRRLELNGSRLALVADRTRTGPIALLIADVDHFKSVNDRFGHDAGDRVLISLARCLDLHARDGDMVGRWGGEEFVLVLRDCTEATAMAAGEALRKSVAELDLGPFGQVTLSIGVVTADSAPQDLSTLIACADVALYRAKDQGRNRVLGIEPRNAAAG